MCLDSLLPSIWAGGQTNQEKEAGERTGQMILTELGVPKTVRRNLLAQAWAPNTKAFRLTPTPYSCDVRPRGSPPTVLTWVFMKCRGYLGAILTNIRELRGRGYRPG